MKILNLFGGLGGNRTLWGNKHYIVAVEYNQQIAYIYSKRFQKDIVIVGDAVRYLLDNFHLFDFIWVSPPCNTHTQLMKFRIQRKLNKGYKEILELPDLTTLYGIILFLKHNYKGYWVVENVKPYYEPLIKPNAEVGRHYFWSNFTIKNKEFKEREYFNNIDDTARVKQIDINFLKKFKAKTFRRDGTLRDMVNPKIGKYILSQIKKNEQTTLF